MEKRSKIVLVFAAISLAFLSGTIGFFLNRLLNKIGNTGIGNTGIENTGIESTGIFNDEKGLRIIHFNDAYDVSKSPRFLSRFSQFKTDDSLTLFSGDIISPSVASNSLKGDQMVPFLNYMQQVYAVPGNHEYDFGEEVFDAFIQKTPETAWLLANLKQKSDPTKSVSNLKESTIVTVKNDKIGLFGLVDTAWLNSNKLNKENYIYEDFLVAAKRVSDNLKKEGCNLVFVITHMTNKDDEQLMLADNSIDIIFGGHEHTYLIRRLNDKLLIKSDSDFAYLSTVNVLFSKSNTNEKMYCDKNCKDYSFSLDYIDNMSQSFFSFALPRKNNTFLLVSINKVNIEECDQEHEGMKNYIQSVVNPTVSESLTPLFLFESKVVAREGKFGYSDMPLGNFFADITRVFYNSDIACNNAGMIKSETTFEANTLMHLTELLKVFPYERDVFKSYKMKGQTVVDLIEESLINSPKSSPHFLSCSGLNYQFYRNKVDSPKLEQNSVKVKGEPIDLDKEYTITLPSGLTHKDFGMKTLLKEGKSLSNGKELSPVELVKMFAHTLHDPAQINEFKVFRQMLPKVTLADLDNFQSEGSESALELQMVVPTNPMEVLKPLNKEALTRLKYYSLASGVVQREQRWIFMIDLKNERRAKRKNVKLI